MHGHSTFHSCKDQERCRFILDAMIEYYFETDLQGTFTFCNKSLCTLLSISLTNAPNYKLAEFMPAKEATHFQSHCQKMVLQNSATASQIDICLIRNDDDHTHLALSLEVMRDTQGEAIGIRGIARDTTIEVELTRQLARIDINELNKARQELSEKEESQRAILDTAPYALAIIRVSDATYRKVNNGFCQKTGYSQEEVVGRTPLELNIYYDLAERERLLETYRKQGKVDLMEIRLVTKDGRVLDTIISISPIKYQGQACLLTITTDITDLKWAQKELKESEASYRIILDSVPHAISINRLSDTTYLFVNEAYCKHTGYNMEEVIGRPTEELNIFVDLTDRQRIRQALLEQNKVDGVEMRFRRKDGSVTHILVSGGIIRYKGEQCLLFISTNIEKLKQIERALKESEESHRAILELVPYSVTILRRSDFRYMLVNDFFCERTNYSKEEIIGHTTAELGLYADLNDREPIVQELREREHLNNREVTFKSKDGFIRYALISARPIRFKNEACILAVSADISELKEAQKALHEREQKYRNILMNMEEGYWEVDLKGTFTFINEAEARLHRCSTQELLGKNNRSFSKPDTAEKVYKIFNNVFQTGIPAEVIDYEMIREDGSLAVIESSASLLKDANGEPIGFFGVSRDITEKKQAEHELEKYRQQLEEMVQERTKALQEAQSELLKRERLAVLGQLTATVSHELRNPLGVIRSSNFYLQRKVPIADDKVEKHFRRIEEQVTLCDTIVADLLEYTRGRTASMVTDHFNPWVEELLNQEQEKQSIQLQRKLANHLPPVAHDQEKMRRVLVNLIDNALQAVKEKEELCQKNAVPYDPTVCIVTQQEGDHILIAIHDNGVGMDEKTRIQAFEPLFTTRARGTGIGLANVKKIIDEHLGDVSIESEVGKGTTVTIKLPCSSAEPRSKEIP